MVNQSCHTVHRLNRNAGHQVYSVLSAHAESDWLSREKIWELLTSSENSDDTNHFESLIKKRVGHHYKTLKRFEYSLGNISRSLEASPSSAMPAFKHPSRRVLYLSGTPESFFNSCWDFDVPCDSQ